METTLSDTIILNRSRMLLGDDAMLRMSEAKVIIFGIGGVGSWCAESLVRSGIRHLTIVDSDKVAPTNINRQLMATTQTIGIPKVAALKSHLLTVAPGANITCIEGSYCEATADSFQLQDYDFIIDAIDSLKDKALLIERATRLSGEKRPKFFSSMGAALKLDPTKVRVAEFYNVKGCPLARALRQRFKRTGRYPGRKFKCVYSEELLSNRGVDYCGEHDPRKAQTNGSLMHITAIFGLTLAGLVIQELAD